MRKPISTACAKLASIRKHGTKDYGVLEAAARSFLSCESRRYVACASSALSLSDSLQSDKMVKRQPAHFFFRWLCANNYFVCKTAIFPPCSVSVSLSTLGKLASRLATPAGSSTAWSTAFSQTARCPLTRPSAEATTPSIPSSARLELESMCPALCLST